MKRSSNLKIVIVFWHFSGRRRFWAILPESIENFQRGFQCQTQVHCKNKNISSETWTFIWMTSLPVVHRSAGNRPLGGSYRTRLGPLLYYEVIHFLLLYCTRLLWTLFGDFLWGLYTFRLVWFLWFLLFFFFRWLFFILGLLFLLWSWKASFISFSAFLCPKLTQIIRTRTIRFKI